MSSWSDHPVETVDSDRLKRRHIVDALHAVLTSGRLATPMVVGVYGGWGSGKTSIMRMLRSRIERDGGNANPLTLWFDSWKYARCEENLWRALLLRVVEALAEKLPQEAKDRAKLENELEELRGSLYRSQTFTERGDLRFNWRGALPFATDLAIRFATLGLSEKLGLENVLGKLKKEDAEEALKLIERDEITRYREQVKSLEQFYDTLKGLIAREVTGQGMTLYVFVDDLDRCLPGEAVSALEAVKIFLDLEGCAFVLGMDRDVVERGIIERYPSIPDPTDPEGKRYLTRVEPRDYLDKIIQLPFTLPPLAPDQLSGYLDELFDKAAQYPLYQECRDLIEVAAPHNPRTLKRILNVFGLLITLRGGRIEQGSAELSERRIEDARRLAAIVLMQVLFDDAYALVADDPQMLVRLQQAADEKGDDDAAKGLVASEPRLRDLLRRAPRFSEGSDNYLRDLVSLAALTSDPSIVGGRAAATLQPLQAAATGGGVELGGRAAGKLPPLRARATGAGVEGE